MSFITYIYRS